MIGIVKCCVNVVCFITRKAWVFQVIFSGMEIQHEIMFSSEAQKSRLWYKLRIFMGLFDIFQMWSMSMIGKAMWQGNRIMDYSVVGVVGITHDTPDTL